MVILTRKHAVTAKSAWVVHHRERRVGGVQDDAGPRVGGGRKVRDQADILAQQIACMGAQAVQSAVRTGDPAQGEAVGGAVRDHLAEAARVDAE